MNWQLGASNYSIAANGYYGSLAWGINGGNATVFSNNLDQLSESEKQYLVAHEFAHTLPDVQNANDGTFGALNKGNPPEERAADAFAQRLLGVPIPPRFIGRY